MFRRLGEVAVRFPIPIIVLWVALAAGVTVVAPRLSDVISTSHASYLPASANSQQATAAIQKAFPRAPASSAIVVVTGPKAQREAAVAAISRYARQGLTPAPSRVQSVATDPQLRAVLDSKDGAATLINLGWKQPDTSSQPGEAVKHLRAYIAAHPYANVTARVTGDVPINLDYQDQINRSSEVTTLATVALVLGIMLLLFRSLVLPIVPLMTIGISILISMGVVATLARNGMIVSQNTPIFMIVLLAGAGTDYCLFLANRYREELLNGAEPAEAVVTTVTHVGDSIASSAVAVMVGMGGMAFAQFGLFNTTGPAVAVSVGITLIAGLTLTPALLALLGRRTFWPARVTVARPSRLWAPLARNVTRHPVIAMLALLVVLAPLNLSVLRTSQTFDFLSDLGNTVEAHAGFNTIEQHYGAGNSQPQTLVIVAPGSLRNSRDLARLDRLNAQLAGLHDATQVLGPTRPAGRPIPYAAYATVPQVAAALDQNLSADGRTATFTVVGATDPYSARAHTLLDAAQARAAAAFPESHVYSAGTTAVAADIQTVSHDDLVRIALFVLGGILVVLVLLLRSVVAPIYLLATVLLSFGATLGGTTLVFQGLAGQSGIVYWVPFLMLTFLIGLGIDYNILLMTRVREEARKGGRYRSAVAHAVERTGSIITSCGLIMAGTFGTLLLASVTGLRELGFAVGVGILFDTFLVRSILVPSLVVIFGRFSWFPGNLVRVRPEVLPRLSTEAEPAA